MTIQLTTSQVKAFYRHDFLPFAEKAFALLNPGRTFEGNWHHDAIASRLEACRTGDSNRLIITVQPRSLKSQMVSVFYPAYVLGRDPTKSIICLSYSQDLALKHARDFRAVVSTPWYRELFPQTIAIRDTETEFETAHGGGRLATSVGGTLTGRGADIIIIDDPLKPEEAMSKAARERVNEFYGSTLYSRLNDKQRGVIILVMQRLHHEDLAGYLLRQAGWTHLNLPAVATRDDMIPLGAGRVHHRRRGDVLHPRREGPAVLEDIKRTLGSAAFQAQYQQAPVPETGNMIKSEWLKYYDLAPVRQEGDLIVQSWDTAMKDKDHNDFSVCTTWLIRNGLYYLLDIVRRHCDYPTLLQLVVAQYRRHSPGTILIEEQAFGAALSADLRRGHGIHPIDIRARGDKVMRLSTASQQIEGEGSSCLGKPPGSAIFSKSCCPFPKVASPIRSTAFRKP